MSSPTIADLRHRAWILANKSIDALNGLNSAIYEGAPNTPAKIKNKPEDTSNINLQYIQDGIDIFNSYLLEINTKTNYINSIQEKNKECMNALTEIMG